MLSCSAGLSSTINNRLRGERRVFLDPEKRRIYFFRRGGFHHRGKGSTRQPVPAILIDREYLYRNMTCLRILLQVVEHGPAQHVRKKDIQ